MAMHPAYAGRLRIVYQLRSPHKLKSLVAVSALALSCPAREWSIPADVVLVD
jgi:hypothetical protein